MKQFFSITIAVLFFAFACNKKDHVAGISSGLLFVNASPNAGTISVLQNLKPVGDFSYLTGFTTAANYVTVDSGFNNYKLKKATAEYATILYANSSQRFSFFVFDTVVSNKLKTFFLKDEIDSAGMGNTSKLRVVQVSPDADTLYLVTAALKDGLDSAFNGSPYFGNYTAAEIFNASEYSSFYTGVRPVKVYSTASNSFIRNYLFNFEKGRIYSFVFKGYRNRGGADSLSLSVIKHN